MEHANIGGFSFWFFDFTKMEALKEQTPVLDFLCKHLNPLPRDEQATMLCSYLFYAIPPSEGLERIRVTQGDMVLELLRSELSVGEDRTSPFGKTLILYEKPHVGLYILCLRPGGSIPCHAHRHMREVEMVLTPGLYVQGEPVVPHMGFSWPQKFFHKYDNPTCFEQRVLCLDQPAFDPSDEIPETQFHTLLFSA